MQKMAPSAVQIAAIIGFVLSCFGLALYLWTSFGGPTPLSPQSYDIEVPFDEATQLADQADVRISGVPVGKVTSIDLPAGGGRAMATLSIDSEYAPLPVDVRATLRSKTLLGETYVELTPGTSGGETLPEDATLPEAQVAETVQLDEILRTFDARTRAGFRTWMRDSAIAIDNRGQSLSNSIALLPPVFEGFERVFRTLDTQQDAVRQLFSDGAVVFDALSERQGQLSSLIESSNAVLETTAARDREIIETFTAFPTFLEESRLTFARLREFALETDPLMRQLVPVARELSPTLDELGRLAPETGAFLERLRPVIDNAPEAFPAFRRLFRDDFPPLLRALDPFLRNLNPFLEVVHAYRRELTALVGNAAAIAEGRQPGGPHYLRTVSPLAPESLATFPRRLQTNRANAYSQPGLYADLATGLQSFETRQCTSGLTASLDPLDATDPTFTANVGGSPTAAQDLFDRLRQFAFSGALSTSDVPAPGCVKQAPFAPFGAPGTPTDYPHVVEQPAP
jgi:phospholipid/cholesterol/gamma-HCH transport system substrate-binding protein